MEQLTDIQKEKQDRDAEICRLRKSGWTLYDLSSTYKLSQSRISQIVAGVLPPGKRTAQGLANIKTREVGRFIFEYMAAHNGRAPRIREIGNNVLGAQSGTPLSSSIVARKLEALAEAGIITLANDRSSRGILIVGAVYVAPPLPEELKEPSVSHD